jgi:hypothetical protein
MISIETPAVRHPRNSMTQSEKLFGIAQAIVAGLSHCPRQVATLIFSLLKQYPVGKRVIRGMSVPVYTIPCLSLLGR